MLFFLLINVKMSSFVGILTLVCKKNFMINYVIFFITSGPDSAVYFSYTTESLQITPYVD